MEKKHIPHQDSRSRCRCSKLGSIEVDSLVMDRHVGVRQGREIESRGRLPVGQVVEREQRNQIIEISRCEPSPNNVREEVVRPVPHASMLCQRD